MTLHRSPRRLAILCIPALAGMLALLPFPPEAVERAYSGLIYPPIQRAITSMSNLTPFAWLDVLLIGLPIAWCGLIVRDLVRSRSAARTLVSWVWRSIVGGATLYLAFLVLWGFNYRRLPLERKLRYDATAVTPVAARDATDLAVSRLNALYAAAHAVDAPDERGIDGALALALARATRELGAPGTAVPARPKRSLLDWYFRPAAVAGMTDPFFLETLVESDLLPFERPFVVAHEWSHLAGFADEGEANFAGWLTCMRADPPAQYSGWLFLFDELANSLPPSDRSSAIARLDAGPRADLRAIAARLARDVRPAVSSAGWRAYDKYLKANRVAAGAASYAQVIRLVLGTRLGLTADGLASPVR